MGVPESVKKAISGQVDDPHLAELAAHFFAAAGGTKAVAKMLLTEYMHAKPGSLARARILDMILRVTKFADDKIGKRDSLGMMTDEDLNAEVEESLKRLPDLRPNGKAATDSA